MCLCVLECVDIVDGSTSRVIRFVWIGSHRMCVYMRVLAFWAIRCNAENTWEPKTSLLQFLYIFFSNFVIFSPRPHHICECNDDTDIKSIRRRRIKKRNKINDISNLEKNKNINFVWFKKIFHFDWYHAQHKYRHNLAHMCTVCFSIESIYLWNCSLLMLFVGTLFNLWALIACRSHKSVPHSIQWAHY